MKKNIAKLYNKHSIMLSPLVHEIKKNVKKGDVVIDLGCGTGTYVKLLKKEAGKKGTVICIDRNSKMIEYCRKKFQKNNVIIKKLSAENLSSIGKKADIVFASLVLQFVNPKKAIMEIKKSLKQDGKLIMAVPLQRTGIEVTPDGYSKDFKSEFLKNLNEELKRNNINQKPDFNYADNREKLFKNVLQKNKFKILEWKVVPLEKANLRYLLDYFKIPWRSERIFKTPFSLRYKIISAALKKTFRKYPDFIMKLYYLIAVAGNN